MEKIKTIKLHKDKGSKEHFLLINNRYAMYLGSDINAIYDTEKNRDIPQYIFKFQELLKVSFK